MKSRTNLSTDSVIYREPYKILSKLRRLKRMPKECGIYEIAQSGDNLLMKFGENYVDANLIMGLDKMFPKRIKLLSGDKPVISYAIKGEYKKILNIVNNLLSTIKELQSAEKDSIIKS